MKAALRGIRRSQVKELASVGAVLGQRFAQAVGGAVPVGAGRKHLGELPKLPKLPKLTNCRSILQLKHPTILAFLAILAILAILQTFCTACAKFVSVDLASP